MNPNFKNKFVWALLITGISLTYNQPVLNLLANFEVSSSKFSINFLLSSKFNLIITVLGIILILIACFLFCRIYLSHKDEEKVFQSLKKASLTIRKPLDDNRRIFVNFGPNSSTASGGHVRMDMQLWEELKQNETCPNNDKIKSILNSVQNLDDQEKSIVEKMRNHIDAFKTHCNNPMFDYSNHQFPLEFSDLIYKYCAELGKSRNRISEYSDWLKVEIITHDILIEKIYFFGSALYGEESTDVDCLIKSEADSIENIENDAKKWTLIKNDFKEKFQLQLHLTIFSKLEEETCGNFLSKLPAYQKVKK